MLDGLELLILAAGQSKRMGISKGLLDVGGIPLLEQTVMTASELNLPIRIVVAKGDSSYNSILLKYSRMITIYENDNLNLGPFYSLQVGSNGAKSLLVTHVDRPLPPARELKKLIREFDCEIVLPYSSQEQGGHPILLNTGVLVEIENMKVSEKNRLDHFLVKPNWTKKKVIVNHPFFFSNINTPIDYQKFLDFSSKGER